MQLDEEEDEPSVDVDTSVEIADCSEWRALSPEPAPPPASIAFVDGTQQLEARVTLEEEGRLVYGALASLAVGAVTSNFRSISVEAVRVHRTLAIACDSAFEVDPLTIPCGSMDATFSPSWSRKPGYAGVTDAINSRRRDLETALGQSMMDQGHPLVILDGRLRLFPAPHTAILGYTKTLHRRYLSAQCQTVLPELRPGQRCPLFRIGEQEPLYSWYLRLTPTRPIDHPLAGIVRLETMAAIEKEQAIQLANQTALYLPQFASPPERDPRAPQNLLPIGGLEARLRHEMGDHTWVRRAIERYLFEQTAS